MSSRCGTQHQKQTRPNCSAKTALVKTGVVQNPFYVIGCERESKRTYPVA